MRVRLGLCVDRGDRWSMRSSRGSELLRAWPTTSATAGHHALFAIAGEWVARLADAHHADVVALKGDSCRLKDRDLGRVPAATTEAP